MVEVKKVKAQRLLELIHLLQLRPLHVSQLARDLGVSVRTVERDLEAITRLGYPVERVERGLYRIPERSVNLHPIEALALFAAGRLLYHQAPTRQYQQALEKLARMLPDSLRDLLLRSTEGLKTRQGESRTLEMVARALLERKVLVFEYRGRRSQDWKRRELQVYFLEANRTNLELYAIGYEKSQNAVRTYKLSRMRNTHLLNESYEIPPDFDPNTYLRHAWGIVGGERKPIEVRLRFFPEAAYRIQEGMYPGLEVEEEQADGSLIARLPAIPFEDGIPWEVLAWIQSFGPRVEVLAPADLRRLWLEEARKLLERASESVAKEI